MTTKDVSVATVDTYRPRLAWTTVIIFQVIYSFAFLDRQVLMLLVDPIRTDLGVTDFQISILQGAAFVLFYSLCGLPIGWAVDRYPRRWLVFCGICFWSVAAAAGGLAQTYWQLLFCRFGVGAGEATLHPTVYSMLTDLFPRSKLTTALAVYSTGAAVGGGISLIVGGFVVGLTSSVDAYHLPIIGMVKPWQMVFIITGAPGLLIAFLVFLTTEPPRRGKIASSAPEARASVVVFMRRQWRFYAAHFVGFGIFGAISAGYGSWVPSYLIRTFDWPVESVGAVLGLQTLICTAAGMLVAGYVCDRLFRGGVPDAHFRFYVWTLTIFGVAGVLAMTSHDITVVLICLSIIKFITPFIPVAAGALQLTAPNEYRGQVSAIFLLVYNGVSWGLGPSLVAGISDFALGGSGDIGLAMAIVFAGFTPLALLIFAWGMKPMRDAVAAASEWSEVDADFPAALVRAKAGS